jgi:manganese-dependent inorganic pyrophosphatase
MLYWGDNAEAVVSRAFNTKSENGIATLPGVVSRKKQVTPALMTTLQSMKEEESE